MTTINISVKGKTALCPKRYLFSSNSNYRLKFNFDEEWNDSEVKTARIVFDNEYYDAVFTGDSVDLPKIPVCKELRVGVFTDALSTGFAQLGCIRSAADFIGDSVTEFTESQYDRIIALLNETDLRQISTVTRRDGNISFNFTNGTSQTVPIFDGVGIESAQVNSGSQAYAHPLGQNTA